MALIPYISAHANHNNNILNTAIKEYELQYNQNFNQQQDAHFQYRQFATSLALIFAILSKKDNFNIESNDIKEVLSYNMFLVAISHAYNTSSKFIENEIYVSGIFTDNKYVELSNHIFNMMLFSTVGFWFKIFHQNINPSDHFNANDVINMFAGSVMITGPFNKVLVSFLENILELSKESSKLGIGIFSFFTTYLLNQLNLIDAHYSKRTKDILQMRPHEIEDKKISILPQYTSIKEKININLKSWFQEEAAKTNIIVQGYNTHPVIEQALKKINNTTIKNIHSYQGYTIDYSEYTNDLAFFSSILITNILGINLNSYSHDGGFVNLYATMLLEASGAYTADRIAQNYSSHLSDNTHKNNIYNDLKGLCLQSIYLYTSNKIANKYKIMKPNQAGVATALLLNLSSVLTKHSYAIINAALHIYKHEISKFIEIHSPITDFQDTSLKLENDHKLRHSTMIYIPKHKNNKLKVGL